MRGSDANCEGYDYQHPQEEEVILDKLPSARDTIARTAAAHARTF